MTKATIRLSTVCPEQASNNNNSHYLSAIFSANRSPLLLSAVPFPFVDASTGSVSRLCASGMSAKASLNLSVAIRRNYLRISQNRAI